MKQQNHKTKPTFILDFQSQRPMRSISLGKLGFGQNIRKDGTFVAKRDQIQSQLWQHHIVEKNIRIQGLLKKLHALCIHYKIPEFYSYFFMLQLSSCSQAKIEDTVLKEIQQIRQKKCHYDIINNSISARESCLSQLSRCLQILFNNTHQQSAMHYFKEEISHYRKLTVYVIEHIRTWKQYLIDISPETQYISYMYKAQNYLTTLLNDNQFIFKSFLSKHVQFSHKNDPFIMRPQIEGGGSKYLQIFFLAEEDKHNYVLLLGYLADQKAKNLQKLVSTKSTKMKQIQDIYMSKFPNLSSSILIRKIHSNQYKEIEMFNIGQSRNQGNENVLETRNKRPFDHHVEISIDQNQIKRKKISDMRDKSEKINKIKIAFGQTSIINPKKFPYAKESFSDHQQAIARSMDPRKHKIQDRHIIHSDSIEFESLMRRKELQILENEHVRGSKLLRPIQRKLETSRLLDNNGGVQELQQIFKQLEASSPQTIQDYGLSKPQTARDAHTKAYMSRNQLPYKLKRLPNLTKTLIQHNEQIVVDLRNKVIREIEVQKAQKDRRQRQRREEDQKVQQVLKKKVDQHVLRALKAEQQKFHIDGKEELAAQFNSRQLFDFEDQKLKRSKVIKLTQIEEQLKHQMQLKWLRDVQQELKRKTQVNQRDKVRKYQDQKLSKDYEEANHRQQLEQRFKEIQREQRAKAMLTQIHLDQKRKKQIQQEIKQLLQRQKSKLQEFTIHQKIQIEGELRQAMKSQILQNLKRQRQLGDQQVLFQKQRLRKQQQYRQQAKSKLQKEFQIQEQVSRMKQKEEKEAKLKVVSQKLEFLSNKIEETQRSSKNKKLEIINQLQKKERNQEQIRQLYLQLKEVPDLRQSVFEVKKVNEHHKKQLRDQFETQLFAFRDSAFYDKQKPQGQQFFVKDFKSLLENDQYLDNKMQQIQEAQHQDKKKFGSSANEKSIVDKRNNNELLIINMSNEQEESKNKLKQNINNPLVKTQINRYSSGSQSQKNFTRFSGKQAEQQPEKEQKKGTFFLLEEMDENHRIKLGMTPQEYKIYFKKKQAINKGRDLNQEKRKRQLQITNRQVKKVIDDFEILQTFLDNEKKSNDINQQILPQIISQEQRNIQQKTANEGKIQEENSHQDSFVKIMGLSENQQQGSKERKSKQNQGFNQASKKQFGSINKEITKNTQKHVVKVPESLLSDSPSKKFLTSQSEQQESNLRGKFTYNKLSGAKRNHSKVPRKKKLKHQNIFESLSEQKQKQEQEFGDLNKLSKQKPKQGVSKLRKIPEERLKEFLDEHFQSLPRVVKKTNMWKREELLKELQGQVTFGVIQTVKEGMSMGLGVAVLNLKKKALRSFELIHVGPYDQDDYLELLLFTARFVFEHDPCEEVTFTNIYDKEIKEQAQFITQFERKFDPHGAIFQKHIINTRFERKYVLRRIINQQRIPKPSTTNYGNFIIKTSLLATQHKIDLQIAFPKVGQTSGCYGMLGCYLATHNNKQVFQDIIFSKEQSNKHLRHLARLALNLNSHQTKLKEITYQEYSNVFELNLDIMRQGNQKQILQCRPQTIQHLNKIVRCEFQQQIPLSYAFKTSLSNFNYDQDWFQAKYIRFRNSSQSKSFSLKCSKLSSLATVLPCKNPKYKILFLNSEQYDGINKQNKTSLDIYLKLFLSNMQTHTLVSWQHIWIPQLSVRQDYAVEQIQKFGQQGIYRQWLNFTYAQHIDNSLKTIPTHRDLFITPPFIMGLLDVQIQKATEGSPLYIRRFDIQDLAQKRMIDKAILQSD